jgi:type VI secretion system secreted protein Hcp
MASDYLLELDGIKGESLDPKHPGTIEVLSFSWGATNQGSFGTGGGAGKVSVHDLTITKSVDASSPKLFMGCATGQHIKSATLYVRKAAQKIPIDYYTIKLTDVLVSSFQATGDHGSYKPQDSFSLNFAKIEFDYRPQHADGTYGPAIIAIVLNAEHPPG